MSSALTYNSCTLCARACGIDRVNGKLGYCGVGSDMIIGRASLHHWEEPIISGSRGSGTIFFSGCSLGCIFCQNRKISKEKIGRVVSESELADIMLRLENSGAHNINFVTPTHYAISVKNSILLARSRGLTIPTVYNTSSYDSVETLIELSGLIDIYLADFKYYRPETAKKYSGAIDYIDVAKAAISEMVRERPTPIIENGIMKSGVIVRILLLPGHLAEAKLSLKYLYETYGDSIYVSLMSQYTPSDGLPKPLDRRVTNAEYSELVDYALRLGVKKCFTQEKESAKEGYIPDFDAESFII